MAGELTPNCSANSSYVTSFSVSHCSSRVIGVAFAMAHNLAFLSYECNRAAKDICARPGNGRGTLSAAYANRRCPDPGRTCYRFRGAGHRRNRLAPAARGVGRRETASGPRQDLAEGDGPRMGRQRLEHHAVSKWAYQAQCGRETALCPLPE